jgi:hypothetical protein
MVWPPPLSTVKPTGVTAPAVELAATSAAVEASAVVAAPPAPPAEAADDAVPVLDPNAEGFPTGLTLAELVPAPLPDAEAGPPETFEKERPQAAPKPCDTAIAEPSGAVAAAAKAAAMATLAAPPSVPACVVSPCASTSELATPSA